MTKGLVTNGGFDRSKWERALTKGEIGFVDALFALVVKYPASRNGFFFFIIIFFRVTDTREIPTVETSDYSGNWQSKTLER